MPKRRNEDAPYWVALRETEKKLIEGALKATKFQRAEAARLLGIDRTYMVGRMRKLGISVEFKHQGEDNWLLGKKDDAP